MKLRVNTSFFIKGETIKKLDKLSEYYSKKFKGRISRAIIVEHMVEECWETLQQKVKCPKKKVIKLL